MSVINKGFFKELSILISNYLSGQINYHYHYHDYYYDKTGHTPVF